MARLRTGEPGLLRTNADFRRLWSAGAISQLGTWISSLAIPLYALLELHATVLEVSLLTTMRTSAALVVGLPAGAWCDRLRRKPIMVAADLGRMLLLGSIPLFAALGLGSIGQLYVVVFLTGVLTIFFDVSNQALVPRLVGRAGLVEGNARLHVNQSLAATIGPTIGGVLVQWLTAPFAVIADAVSYLVSALCIRGIRTEETTPPKADRPRLVAEIREGLRFVFGHPVIRPIACYVSVECFFQSAGYTGLLTVFLVGPMRLSPSAIGLVGGIAMIGAVISALVAKRIADTLGQLRGFRLGAVVMGVGSTIMSLAQPGWGLGLYIFGDAVFGFAIIVSIVTEVSLCQSLCPDELRGRMTATMRFMTSGAMPIGSLVGGFVATAMGVRPTIMCAGVGILLSGLWMLRLRLPAVPESE